MIYTQEALTEMTQEAARWYLAGMIDGEGSVTDFIRKDRGTRVRRIYIYNTEPNLIEACKEACEVLGLRYSVHTAKKKGDHGLRRDCFALTIGSEKAIRRAAEILPIQHPKKRQRLDSILESETHGEAAWRVRRENHGPTGTPPKTTCVNDHPKTEENTYLYQGSRYCRICRREATRRSREKIRATEIGEPEENPDVVVEPLRDPIPREDPVPEEDPILVPA